jgi:hypothetical protein
MNICGPSDNTTGYHVNLRDDNKIKESVSQIDAVLQMQFSGSATLEKDHCCAGGQTTGPRQFNRHVLSGR